MHLEILSGVFKDPRERRQSRTRGPPPNGRFATEGPSHFAMDLQRARCWSWDITYLKSPIRGVFFYLYTIVDVWSRKVVGWQVHEDESAELAAALFEGTCAVMQLNPCGIVLHADNGGPMKGRRCHPVAFAADSASAGGTRCSCWSQRRENPCAFP